MAKPFLGGFGKAIFLPSTGDFTTLDGTEISFDKTQFIPDGSSMPDPEIQTAAVGNDQSGPTAITVPFELRFNNVDAADADTLQTSGFDLTPYDVQILDEREQTEVIIRDVILQVATKALTEANGYGFVRIVGQGRHLPNASTPTYEITQNNVT